MSIAAFTVVYGVTSIVCALASMRHKSVSILMSLSGVLGALAFLNFSMERPRIFQVVHASSEVCLLIAIFLLPYGALAVQLMEKRQGMRWLPAIWSTWLPLVVLLFIALGAALGPQETDNLPFAVFTGIGLVCILHVPMFAYGKSTVLRTMKAADVPNAGIPTLATGTIRLATVALWLPFVVLLGIESVTGNSWLELIPNVMVTGAIFTLFIVAGG